MAESIITMEMKKVKDFEWSSLLDLTGKGLDQFNAVGKDMNCTQLMHNAGLDWNVEMKPVQFTDDNGTVNESDRLHSLVKDNKEVLKLMEVLILEKIKLIAMLCLTTFILGVISLQYLLLIFLFGVQILFLMRLKIIASLKLVSLIELNSLQNLKSLLNLRLM